MEPGTRPSSPVKQQWQAVDLSFDDANGVTTSDIKNIESKQQYEGTLADVNQNMEAFTSRLKEYGSGAEEEKFDFRFYLALSGHKEVNPSWKRFKVKYDIDWRLDEDWKETLIKCFGIIETAYPGIQIGSQICYSSTRLISANNNTYITINDEERAFTIGDMIRFKECTISLGNKWKWHRQGTALHEILHSIGILHEQGRTDRDRHIKIKDPNNENLKKDKGQEVTPFDPFSVMLYSEEDESIERIGDTNIWKLKGDRMQPNNLSELDKIGTNIPYPPAIIYGVYEPKIGKSGLYYGGRNVMKGHNFPADDISDGVGGPDWGPNCPAGRTLRTDKIDELNKNWIFQGYSGMIYCAKEMEKRGEGHDGYCGPDNGSPCDSCLALIYDKNEIKDISRKINAPKVHKESIKRKIVRSGTIFLNILISSINFKLILLIYYT